MTRGLCGSEKGVYLLHPPLQGPAPGPQEGLYQKRAVRLCRHQGLPTGVHGHALGASSPHPTSDSWPPYLTTSSRLAGHGPVLLASTSPTVSWHIVGAQ